MLTFDADLHEYRWNGTVVPSVTTILKPLSSIRFVDADVLEAAQRFGTAVHKACELHDLGDLDEESLDPALVPYLDGWKRFQADRECKWHSIEKPLYHTLFRFAGTPDRIGWVDGKMTVVDIKSGTGLFPTVGPQTAAYQALYNRNQLHLADVRLAVRLKDDGTYAVAEYTAPADWSVFMSLITLREWCGKHSIKPRFED